MTFVGEILKDAVIGLEKAVLLSMAACSCTIKSDRKRCRSRWFPARCFPWPAAS